MALGCVYANMRRHDDGADGLAMFENMFFFISVTRTRKMGVCDWVR